MLTLLASFPLRASPENTSVLVIVPPGSELAAVERARSAAPTPGRALLVSDSDRVLVKGGFELLLDGSFASAPPADLVVLLPGDVGRAAEAFLLERSRTARAILLPPSSPVAEKIRGQGPGGALVLFGTLDSVAAVLDALGAGAALGGVDASTRPSSPTPAARPRPSEPTAATRPAIATPPPATPTPAASGRVFDRYFSSRPTPSPTPR
jgi:hypothetical protein